MSTLLRIAIGIIIIAHGVVHPILSLIPDDKVEGSPAGSFWSTSWLLGEKPYVKTVNYVLSGIAAVLLLLAGLSFMGFIMPQAWWQTLWIAGAAASALELILFWNPQFFIGLIIDTVMIGLLYFTSFSPE